MQEEINKFIEELEALDSLPVQPTNPASEVCPGCGQVHGQINPEHIADFMAKAKVLVDVLGMTLTENIGHNQALRDMAQQEPGLVCWSILAFARQAMMVLIQNSPERERLIELIKNHLSETRDSFI